MGPVGRAEPRADSRAVLSPQVLYAVVNLVIFYPAASAWTWVSARPAAAAGRAPARGAGGWAWPGRKPAPFLVAATGEATRPLSPCPGGRGFCG